MMSAEGRARQVAAVTSLKVREKHRQRAAVQWRDPEYVKAQMRARGVRPNRLELEVQEVIRRFGFQYAGDGKLVVGGKCPDFWNGDGKVIELYGDYWHAGQDPRERIDLFAAHGYVCLVIWEREWREDPVVVAERVAEFAWGLAHG